MSDPKVVGARLIEAVVLDNGCWPGYDSKIFGHLEGRVTPEEAYEGCIASFPMDAYKSYKPKGDQGPQLTSLKAHCVRERLCQVFGLTGWTESWDTVFLVDGEACTTTHLVVAFKVKDHKSNDWVKTALRFCAAPGGSPIITVPKGYRFDPGDAIKSAVTDGLTKAASQLGIGNEMFKGEINLKGGRQQPKNQAEPANIPEITEEQMKQIIQLQDQLGINDNQLCSKTEKLYSKSAPSALNTNQARNLIQLMTDGVQRDREEARADGT